MKSSNKIVEVKAAMKNPSQRKWILKQKTVYMVKVAGLGLDAAIIIRKKTKYTGEIIQKSKEANENLKVKRMILKIHATLQMQAQEGIEEEEIEMIAEKTKVVEEMIEEVEIEEEEEETVMIVVEETTEEMTEEEVIEEEKIVVMIEDEMEKIMIEKNEEMLDIESNKDNTKKHIIVVMQAMNMKQARILKKFIYKKTEEENDLIYIII